jgi:predicted nucleic acid-binding protein
LRSSPAAVDAGGRVRRSMSADRLLDTNILVYAHDSSELRKQRVAQGILDEARARGSVAICAQVLGEYLSVVAGKFAHVLDVETAASQVHRFSQVLEVHETDFDVVMEASRGARVYGLPYYDAQIWAVARLHHIPVVISEDFADGTEVEGVRFENPFVE